MGQKSHKLVARVRGNNEGGKKRESKKGQGELLPSTSYISTTPHNKLQFTSVESASTCVLRAEVHSNKSLRSKIPTMVLSKKKKLRQNSRFESPMYCKRIRGSLWLTHSDYIITYATPRINSTNAKCSHKFPSWRGTNHLLSMKESGETHLTSLKLYIADSAGFWRHDRLLSTNSEIEKYLVA